MSNFVEHQPCPRCHSRDNLGVWDDGHKYCFGCGYKVGKVSGRFIKNNNKNKEQDVISLPLDYSIDLPDLMQTWLDNYGLTAAEVYSYKLGWSESLQRLIFPVYERNVLTFWQGRYFGKGLNLPKHISRGKSSDILHILDSHNESNTVVCCEDMISAIKITRFENAWCLFGSHISTEALERASRLYQKLGVWLDKDKAGYALRTVLRASIFFQEVHPILSEKDPKWYNDVELKEWLTIDKE